MWVGVATFNRVGYGGESTVAPGTLIILMDRRLDHWVVVIKEVDIPKIHRIY